MPTCPTTTCYQRYMEMTATEMGHFMYIVRFSISLPRSLPYKMLATAALLHVYQQYLYGVAQYNLIQSIKIPTMPSPLLLLNTP